MVAYAASQISVGASGYRGGSNDPDDLLASASTNVYSALLIVFGLFFILSVGRSRKAALWAIWGMAFATGLHGFEQFHEGDFQTGLRLMTSPLMMIPAGWCWWLAMTILVPISRPDPEDETHAAV